MKIEANGIHLNVETAGESGPAVLLVHGLGGSLRQWHGVSALLAPTCRVIAMDLRGHGESDRPTVGYSIRAFADDLAGVCKALKVERGVAVGASVAGAVVVQFAADYPELAQAIVPVGGFAAMPPAGRERMGQRAAEVEKQGMTAVADGVVAAALGPSTHASNPSLVGLQKALLLANEPRAYAASARAVASADVTAAMPRVKCPVLLVFGSEEKVAPLPAQAALKKGMPHAQLRAIPQAGHLAFLEQPHLFAAALMEFLAALG
jgi:3-oxoadipate enol-lactonase